VAWTESGLFFATWRDIVKNVIAADITLTTQKIALSNNTETPDFISATDPSTWTTTNEVSGTGWASGGIALSAAAAGSTSTAPSVTQSPSKTLMWDMGDVSVATTTLTNAFGAYIYLDSLTPKAKVIGIYFGGSGFSTVAGTFAITWNALGVATIVMAA
jgi:hypothetical protein